jgi:cell division protein FtsI/penicillin-binding protein 2
VDQVLGHRAGGVRAETAAVPGSTVQLTIDEDLQFMAQRALADAVFQAAGAFVPEAAAPLYARIDLVQDADGRPVVMELELTEPSLFLPQAPGGAATLVRAVEAELSR